MASLITQLGKLFSNDGKNNSSGALGIEIGASSIKVVQVGFGEDRAPTLETYGEIQLGPYAHKESGQVVALSPKGLAEALATIMREASVTTTRAALAIPYKASFIVNITLPTQDPAQLATMVPIEARKYVPLPMNEVTLDWSVIPDAPKPADPQKQKEKAATPSSRILLAAIHNETFAQYQAVTKGVGLADSSVEIEAFSVLRSCLSQHDAHVMVLDYGASAAKIHVVNGGVVQEVHHTTSGSESLTTALMQGLSISFSDAERLKRQSGLTAGEDARVRTTIEPLVDRVLVAGKRVLDAYERSGGAPIKKVITTGGGALLPGFDARAKEMFGREVVRAKPFGKVYYPDELEQTLVDIGPTFATAIGVALRRLFERS